MFSKLVYRRLNALVFIGALALAATLACQAASKKESIHHQIAKYAAVLATNRLAQDQEDQDGKLLLRLAAKLHPKEQRALLTLGLLEKGMAPKPIKTKRTEKELFGVMRSQAERLLESKAGVRQAALYLRVIERFQPRNEKVLLHLMNLRVDGVATGLEELLTQPLDAAVGRAEPAAGEGWAARPAWVAPGAKQCLASGKWYLLVTKDEAIGWYAAGRECFAMRGRLACVRDWDDNDFLTELAEGKQVWLGATDFVDKSPYLHWKWVDFTPFLYSNWAPDNPPLKQRQPTLEEKDAGAGYSVRQTHSLSLKPNGEWEAMRRKDTLQAFICEWDGAKQVPRDKRLQTPYPKDAKLSRGHAYRLFHHRASWAEAKRICEAMGGYLACLESESENQFMAASIGPGEPWIGGWDPERRGRWKWVNGNAITHRNWARPPTGAPKDGPYYMVIRISGTRANTGTWIPMPGEDYRNGRAFICEWDAASIKRNARPIAEP